jgi:hypothetical protein
VWKKWILPNNGEREAGNMGFEVLTGFPLFFLWLKTFPHLKLASGVCSLFLLHVGGYTAWLPWRIQFKDKEKAWLTFDLKSELQSNLFGREAGRQAGAKSFIYVIFQTICRHYFIINACTSLSI